MYTVTFSTLAGEHNVVRKYLARVHYVSTINTFREMGWVVVIDGKDATLTHPNDW